MNRREEGYATIMVVSIMLGLSIIAVAVLERTSASAAMGQKVSQSILLDAQVEGALHETVANIINGGVSLRASGHTTTLQKSDRVFHISVSPESSRINLNRAPLNGIELALAEHVQDADISTQIMKNIETARGDQTSVIKNMNAILPDTISAPDKACLHDYFTLFQSTAKPSSAASGRAFPDGSVLRIKVETRDADHLNRGVEAVILLTGKHDDPAWIMDWHRYTAPQQETCES